MISAIVQTIASAILGFVLWRALRSMARTGGPAGAIVVLGLVARAGAGLAAFWVSYLELPVLTSLRIGKGFWFYARDGKRYYEAASTIASQGLDGIVGYDQGAAGGSFVQTLGAFCWCFGDVPSIGLLLNSAAYTITCGVLLAWGTRAGALRRGAVVSLVLYCCSPSLILWWTQPLKETVFYSAAALFLYAWMRVLTDAELSLGPRRQVILAQVALLGVSSWMIAGTRPYFVFIAWVAAAISLVPSLIGVRRRGLVVAALCIVATLVVARPLVVGGDSARLPAPVRALIDPSAWKTNLELVRPVMRAVAGARLTLEINASGATDIQAGRLLHWLDRRLAAPAPDPRLLGGHDYPRGFVTKFLGGAAASVIPRFIAMPAVIRIEGGRGFWFFAEADTLFFDVALALVLVGLLRRPARLFRSPMAWMLLLVTVALAVPMLYVTVNFGTLLRLRGMFVVLLAMMPLTVARDDDPASFEQFSGAGGGALPYDPQRGDEREWRQLAD